MTLKEAMDAAGEIMPLLEKIPQVKRISPAGSLRRMKETIRDIDILVSSEEPKKVMGAFVKMPVVKEIVSHGDTKSSILTAGGVQVDIRVVGSESFGAALVYFTGSKAHSVHMRSIAKRTGLKINEYGVFSSKSGKRLAGREEKDVYKALNMAFVPPELREDRGEVEAALKGRLPSLIGLSDIRADLHVHSDWSDGDSSIKDIAEACRAKGYRYVVIADHSKALKVAGGLSEKEAAEKLKEIEALNDKLKGFRILSGAEVEISDDGGIDYGDGLLKEFDIVIAAVHSGFKQPRAKLTNRILKAMDNKHVHIIAHPTARHMGVRDACDIDLDAVFKAARDTNTALEINAYPERMDLDDVNSRAAKEAGVKIAIGTDAHTLEHLELMVLGVAVARRAWLTRKDILNTLSADELLKAVRK
jgi:DNA polymerase (family 10)